MALHVWVFYFDYSDLSIVELYRPPAWGLHGEATLPAVGSLFVDHGTNGGKAFSSYLRANQDVDVGFFKVFMSTVPIDLSHVEQRSPFETKCPRGIHLKKVTPLGAFWDAITIPVVQRRPDPTHVLAESA
ncbi:hypothetical protein PENSPDRAFT_695224 [Peniophora sp. CONT]|nr:hypothetical protein PENSPDRAFT_695224 [Peniophora sp. CONT]